MNVFSVLEVSERNWNLKVVVFFKVTGESRTIKDTVTVNIIINKDGIENSIPRKHRILDRF